MTFKSYQIRPTIDWGDQTKSYANLQDAQGVLDRKTSEGEAERDILWTLYGITDDGQCHAIGDWLSLSQAKWVAMHISPDVEVWQ